MTHQIRIKRIYQPPSQEDGQRILVDGIWPRGVKKADAGLDEWIRDLAPTKALRQWFGHKPERWSGFRKGYRDELAQHPETLQHLMALCRDAPVTLLFAAKDEARNNAVVLQEVLREELAEEARPEESSSPVCYGSGTYWGDDE